jgi:hypothetical protein
MSRSKPKASSKRLTGGEKILAGLRELHHAIIGGDKSKLAVHTVETPDPASHPSANRASLVHRKNT